jgi:S-adenosylmethionine synthetase
VDTYGTGAVSEKRLEEMLKSSQFFDFRPASITDDLDLTHPEGWSYQDTAAYGHFGRNCFPWEKTDKARSLRAEGFDQAAA